MKVSGGDKRMIRMIMGSCFVGNSDDQAMAYFLERVNKGSWDKLPEATRKAFRTEVLKEHKANRDLYYSVMRGF